MSDFVISADVRGLDRLMNELQKLGGPDAGTLLRKRSGMLARVCAEQTQPAADRETGGQITAETVKVAANTAAARRLGEGAIKADLRRIFDVLDGYTAEQARGSTEKLVLYKGGGRRGGDRKAYLIDRQHYASNDASMHQFHQSRRLPSNGRVSTAGLREQRNGRWKSGATMVANRAQFNAYLKKALARVGFSKAAWITAARMIPGGEGFTKLPAWITRHHGAPGVGIDRTRGDNPHVVLVNQVPWAAKIMRPAQIDRIGRAFALLIRKDILAQIDHLGRRNSANT